MTIAAFQNFMATVDHQIERKRAPRPLLYQDYLTGTEIDRRKVKKVALLRARHDRDISVIGVAGIKYPDRIGLSTVLMWRRRAARALLIAGHKPDGYFSAAKVFADHFANALETAQGARRNLVGQSSMTLEIVQ